MTRAHFWTLTAAIAASIGLGVAVVIALELEAHPVVVEPAEVAAAPERFTYQDIAVRVRCSRGPRDARDDAERGIFFGFFSCHAWRCPVVATAAEFAKCRYDKLPFLTVHLNKIRDANGQINEACLNDQPAGCDALVRFRYWFFNFGDRTFIVTEFPGETRPWASVATPQSSR